MINNDNNKDNEGRRPQIGQLVGRFGFDYNGWMAQRHNCLWHDGTKAGWYKDTIR